MLTTRLPGGTERTWRPPLARRVTDAIAPGLLFSLLLALWLIVAQEMTNGAWTALALAAAAWGVLARRALTTCVTLTTDTLAIRGILATERVPVAHIAGVSFRRGRLTVTCAHGTAAGMLTAVPAVYLGASRWSGLRSDADDIAEAVTAAAGLPALPPRREIITRTWAWIMLLAAAPCLGIGIYYYRLLQNWNVSKPSSLFFGAFLFFGAEIVLFTGAAMLGLGFRIIRDHHRKRPRQAASGQD